MATSKFELGGVALLDVLGKIEETAVSKTEAASILAGWLLENVGRTQRNFFIHTLFFPDCTVPVTRSFAHQNWKDGEDVVQAEDYGDVIGFNTRFNNIAADLDSLAAAAVHLAGCVNELKGTLAVMLGEVTTEINRINADLFKLTNPDQGGIAPGTVVTPGKFLGHATLFDKEVQLFQTPQGVLTLPLVLKGNPEPYFGRLDRVGELAGYLEATPGIRDAITAGPITRAQIVENFGTEVLPSGVTIAEAVAILPPESTFTTVDAIVDAVAEREAGLIRATGGTEATIATTFGLGTEIASVGDVSVDRVSAIDAGARTALNAAGVDTVEKLATVSAAEIVSRAEAAGHQIALSDAASLAGRARTILRLR